VQKIVRCLLSLPVLPPDEIVQAVSDIRPEIDQWINKRSVAGVYVITAVSHTNNVMESYHALKRQMLVSHPNMFFSVYIDDDCIGLRKVV